MDRTARPPKGAAAVTKRLARYYECPTEFSLDVLGGKWKTVLLCYLKQRPLRYSELRILVPRLSDKVLTERLRDLTEAGLVVRRKPAGRTGHEVYDLTTRARSMGKLLAELYRWGLDHAQGFGVEVGQPFTKLETQRAR
jgi:DNA-binding HxlR family transcriptional regulator